MTDDFDAQQALFLSMLDQFDIGMRVTDKWALRRRANLIEMGWPEEAATQIATAALITAQTQVMTGGGAE